MKNLLTSHLFRFLSVMAIGFLIWFGLYHAFAFSNAEYCAVLWEKDTRISFAFLSMLILCITVFIAIMSCWSPF